MQLKDVRARGERGARREELGGAGCADVVDGDLEEGVSNFFFSLLLFRCDVWEVWVLPWAAHSLAG